MFKAVKELFSKSLKESNPSDADLKLAAATLMFELIRSDGHIDDVELRNMKHLLKNEFSLNDDDVELLIKNAESNAQQAISLQGFTREVCDNWGNEQRIKLLEYLWILALSDNVIDRHERHLVRKLAGLLYLNDNEISVARERAKAYVITDVKK